MGVTVRRWFGDWALALAVVGGVPTTVLADPSPGSLERHGSQAPWQFGVEQDRSETNDSVSGLVLPSENEIGVTQLAPIAVRWPAPRVSRTDTTQTPEAPIVSRRRSRPDDLGEGSYFQLPSARVLRYGDLVGRYVSHLGWAGVRAGLTSSVDVGVGVPYYLAGVSLDLRVAFVQTERFSAAWWGFATVPFLSEGERPGSYMGFTWAYAGVGWMTGPLVTVNIGRVTVSAGVHLAQRTGLGGVWLFDHATVDFRVSSGVKLLVQGVTFIELGLEQADRARSLLGNGTARVLPYTQAGVRFFGRSFAADMGVLVPLSEACPLWSPRLAVIPSISLTHRF